MCVLRVKSEVEQSVEVGLTPAKSKRSKDSTAQASNGCNAVYDVFRLLYSDILAGGTFYPL